jgi:hypothetical protein
MADGQASSEEQQETADNGDFASKATTPARLMMSLEHACADQVRLFGGLFAVASDWLLNE